ncbi:MAG: YeeE/YedE thiosulfate transporter family protein [Bacteroidia bacterium]|nr:YeeE/YedE thiosulfate transporter family protein [Bacteroidia bacterium]
MEILRQPWPWYVAGPLIGLIVPLLLLAGNKHFGISSSLRHICAMTVPAGIPFFSYDWKKEQWNLFFIAGICLGAGLAVTLLGDPQPLVLAPQTASDLRALGVEPDGNLMPMSLFGPDRIPTAQGLVFFVLGGFLVGFGTRYAGGCTSGHSIMGLSTLQWPSLVATCCFMAGGFLMTLVFLPMILQAVN